MIQRVRIAVVIGVLTLVVPGCRALSLTAKLDNSPMPLAVCYRPVEEDHFKGEMRFRIRETTVDHPGTAVDATLVVTETEPHLYPTPLRGSHWAGSGTRIGESLSDLDLVLHPTDATQELTRLDVRITIYWDSISGIILDTYNPDAIESFTMKPC